jgi:hypothetical protein
MKEEAKNAFLETDTGKNWAKDHPGASSKSFQIMTKEIATEVDTQK